nr:ABC transporter permease [uncultured Celeribacter sp.]
MSVLITFLKAVLNALRDVLADPGARSTMVAAIFIYSLLYPQPYVGELVRDVPVVAIDQDNSTASRAFLRNLDASDRVEIVQSVATMEAARAVFYQRDAYGIVLIPQDFEQDLLSNRPAPVAAFGDGSYLLIYSNLMSAVSGVARNLGAQVNYNRLTARGVDDGQARALIAPVTVTSIPVFNPSGGYAAYIVPAAFVLILQQTLLMGIGLLHAGRPLPKGVNLVATPVAYVALYTLWTLFTQLFLPFAYDIPRTGDIATLMMVSLPFLSASTAMGFAVAIAIPWREGVVFFLVVLGLPLFFLSGISWPVESIPAPLHLLALLVPSSSAIPAIVAVDQMGAQSRDVAGTIELQLALTVGYTLLAVLMAWLTRHRHHAAADDGETQQPKTQA